jgi:Mg2+ and Co2+ transporter CorA
MPFGLQSDIPDRAIPDALKTLLVRQTEALKALLDHTQHAIATLRAVGNLSPQEQVTQIDVLTQEVAERLTALEDQNAQMQKQLEAFQRLLRQQVNPILAYTVERMKEVLAANLMVARQHLDALIHGYSPE